jgi:hypothetical protein
LEIPAIDQAYQRWCCQKKRLVSAESSKTMATYILYGSKASLAKAKEILEELLIA